MHIIVMITFSWDCFVVLLWKHTRHAISSYNIFNFLYSVTLQEAILTLVKIP